MENISKEEISLSLPTPFTGSLDLLKFILTEYNINNGNIAEFAKANGFNASSKKPCRSWDDYGVPLRIWNICYKNLTILSLEKNQEIITLQELKQQFNSINESAK